MAPARLALVLSLGFLALASDRLAAQTTPSKPAFPIAPEPFVFRPGDALNIRTLVQRPPAIMGLLSWTIETRRHRGQIGATALSPDGKRFATAGSDSVIRIWEVESGTFIRAFVGHSQGIAGLAWSPDGNTLASAGGSEANVRLWDTNTGMTLRILKGHKAYTHHVAWSPDGKSLVVAGGSSGFVTLWDLAKGEQVRTVEVGNPISSIAWSPNNLHVAIAGRASGVQVRELRENTNPIEGLLVPDQNGTAVAWSPDGKLLVGGSPMKAIVWNAEDGKQLQELEGPCSGLAFSPDGTQLAVTGLRDVSLWKTANLTEKPKTVAVVTARVVEWAPDSATLFATIPYSIVRYAADTPKEVGRIDAAGDAQVLAQPGRPFVTGLNTKTPLLWDGTAGKPVVPLEGHTALVTTASWSRDGKYLATASLDKSIRIWDPTGKPVKTLLGHEAAVTCIAWAEGQTLASGSPDKTIRIWQAASDTLPRMLPKLTDAATVLSWSKDGKTLAVGGLDKKVQTWQVDSDKPSNVIPVPGPVRAIAWAGNAKTIAVSMNTGELQVFSTAGGKQLQAFSREGGNPATSLAWGPDGTTLLAARSAALQLWRSGSAMVLNTIYCLASVVQVTWAPTGAAYVSCTDRCARVYDIASDALRSTIVASDNQQMAIVSANGHYRVTDEEASELVYVVQTPNSQETMTPKEFATKYRFRNLPASAALPGGK